jgi:hypothetical protein
MGTLPENTKTNTITSNDWLQATRNVVIFASEPFTKADFERDLRKVSKKRNLPIGENIRDAVRSIKGE